MGASVSSSVGVAEGSDVGGFSVGRAVGVATASWARLFDSTGVAEGFAISTGAARLSWVGRATRSKTEAKAGWVKAV